MRTIRIYQPGNYAIGQSVELTSEASQHVGVVLRMTPGEELTLFCGDDREFLVTIEAVRKKQVVVQVNSMQEISRESPLRIHLAQAISKGDRMEFVMQKAVELGVASITPIISDRCVVKLDKDRMAKKIHQWQSIAIAACEQSGRNQVPEVHTPISFAHHVQDTQVALKLVLHPEGAKTWRDYSLTSTPISLLIGPEGGFTDDEIKMAAANGFHHLTLGPRILRTETAAIAALSVLQAVAGDL